MLKRKEILIATENKGKIKEIREIFADSIFEVHFLDEFRQQLNGIVIQENAKSFEGNALIKAIVIGDALGMITLADDSGICVDALDGRPGVYSARYSEAKTDIANYEKVLEELTGVPLEKRVCHYNCTVAVYDPITKFVETVNGEWHGKIALAPKGDKSFGYSPIFLPEEFSYLKTSAEFEHEELIKINHRGKAFRAALKILEKFIK